MTEPSGLSVRRERPADERAVTALLRSAFEDDVPARLAQRLRADGLHLPELTAVASLGSKVVGSLMISRVLVRGEGRHFEALNLTPFAVAPSYQGRGVGRRLMTWVLTAAERTAYPLVLLEGDPQHYVRYGFERSTRFGIERPSERIPGEAFQVRLLPGHRPDVHRGVVEYPAVFFDLDVIGP